MELIYETWHSETVSLQPCAAFQKYYWLDHKPLVYSEQKIFCHLVFINSLHWLISLEGGVIIPSEALNYQQSTQNKISLNPTFDEETRQKSLTSPRASGTSLVRLC